MTFGTLKKAFKQLDDQLGRAVRGILLPILLVYSNVRHFGCRYPTAILHLLEVVSNKHLYSFFNSTNRRREKSNILTYDLI